MQSKNSGSNILNNRFIVLDFARGFAAFTILIFHTYQYEMFSSLYSSVDFFFVLSGFVLLPSIDRIKSKIDILNFIRSRAVRLLPMSIATIIFVIFIQKIVDIKHFIFKEYDKEGVSLDPKTLIIAFLLLQIFSTNAQLLNGPLWSLSVEWLSNIAIAIFPSTRSIRYALPLVFGITLQIHSMSGGASWEMPLGRGLFAFAFGAVTRKYIYEKWQNTRLKTLTCVVLILIFHSVLIFWNSDLIAVAPLVFAFLILNLSKLDNSLPKAFLGVSHFFGRYSYGFYAWHFPLLMLNSVFIRRLLSNIPEVSGWTIHVVFITTIGLSLLMTNLVIRYIEPKARELFLPRYPSKP